MFQSEVSDANFLHFARTVVQPFMMALKGKVDPKVSRTESKYRILGSGAEVSGGVCCFGICVGPLFVSPVPHNAVDRYPSEISSSKVRSSAFVCVQCQAQWLYQR